MLSDSVMNDIKFRHRNNETNYFVVDDERLVYDYFSFRVAKQHSDELGGIVYDEVGNVIYGPGIVLPAI